MQHVFEKIISENIKNIKKVLHKKKNENEILFYFICKNKKQNLKILNKYALIFKIKK